MILIITICTQITAGACAYALAIIGPHADSLKPKIERESHA